MNEISSDGFSLLQNQNKKGFTIVDADSGNLNHLLIIILSSLWSLVVNVLELIILI